MCNNDPIINDYYIDGEKINGVYHTRDLGAIMDPKL